MSKPSGVPAPSRELRSSTTAPLPESSVASHSTAAGTPAASLNPNQSQLTADVRRSKRSRKRGDTTRIACHECQEKRTKCDGQSPCERCRSKGLSCQYTAPQSVSKSELRQEIQTLRDRLSSSEKVVNSLLRYTEGSKMLDHETGEGKTSIDGHVIASLPSLDTKPPLSPKTSKKDLGLTRKTQEDSSSKSPEIKVKTQTEPMAWVWKDSNYQLESPHVATKPSKGQDLASAKDTELPFREYNTNSRAETDSAKFLAAQQLSFGKLLAPGCWTTVTDDVDLVHHLLALFFCWEYPTFVSMSKDHFIHDFRTGNMRYCSTILVNAILALGCRFSNQPVGRSDREDPFSAGDLFFTQATQLLETEPDQHSITSVQALGLMSLREISCGRHREAQYLASQAIRLAVEMGLHLPAQEGLSPDELTVMSVTFWGAYALDSIWSAITPRLPYFSKTPRLPNRYYLKRRVENTVWIPYVDEGAMAEHQCVQPVDIGAVFHCFSQLSEIVHRTSYQQQLPASKAQIADINKIYISYLAWFDGAPELARVGKHSTPAVLFLHMYFQFSILTLLWPVVDVDSDTFDLAPRRICWEAAIAIEELAMTFAQLYTLRRMPAFASHILTTACIALISMTRSNAEKPTAPAPATTSSILERLPLAISNAVESLAEIAMSQKGAQRELAKVQYLIHGDDLHNLSHQ